MIVGLELMESNDEPLEAGHVGIRAVPREQEGVGPDHAQLEAVDGGQRAQLGVLHGEQVPVVDGRGLGALRPDLRAPFLRAEPLAVLPQPNFLHVGLTRANQRVSWKKKERKSLKKVCPAFLLLLVQQ